MSNSLNPYNEKNKKITYNSLNNIFGNINLKLKINNLELYQSSLLHKSYTFKNNYEINNSDYIAEKPKNCIDLFNIEI